MHQVHELIKSVSLDQDNILTQLAINLHMLRKLVHMCKLVILHENVIFLFHNALNTEYFEHDVLNITRILS